MAIEDQIYREILRIREEGGRAALATIVRTKGSTPGALGAKMLVSADGKMLGSVGGGCVEAEVASLARQVIGDERPRHGCYRLNGDMGHDSGLICGGELEVFVEPVSNPLLYILGGGHIGLALAKLASMAGFRFVVIDDRERFANPERFPEAMETLAGEFDELLSGLRARKLSYVAVATRGHRHDLRALEWALEQDARYVGLLGSKVKIKKIKNQLQHKGIAIELIEKIHAPIGLDIGALTVEEIAIAIMAELISVRRTGQGRKVVEPKKVEARRA